MNSDSQVVKSLELLLDTSDFVVKQNWFCEIKGMVLKYPFLPIVLLLKNWKNNKILTYEGWRNEKKNHPSKNVWMKLPPIPRLRI